MASKTAQSAVQAHSASMINAMVSGCALTAISTVLAQVLGQWRIDGGLPPSLNTTPILHFLLYTIFNTPINFLWQEYLEDSYPAYDTKPAVLSEKASPSRKGVVTQKKLSITNTMIKFVLDQSIGAVYNTIAFLVVMQAFKGASAPDIWNVVKKDSYPLMSAGWKLWPLVSLLSFTVIPPGQRMVFGSLVSMGWNIFLALMTSS